MIFALFFYLSFSFSVGLGKLAKLQIERGAASHIQLFKWAKASKCRSRENVTKLKARQSQLWWPQPYLINYGMMWKWDPFFSSLEPNFCSDIWIVCSLWRFFFADLWFNTDVYPSHSSARLPFQLELVASTTAKNYKNKRKQPALLIPQRGNDWPPHSEYWLVQYCAQGPATSWISTFYIHNWEWKPKPSDLQPSGLQAELLSHSFPFCCFCPNKKKQRPLKYSKFIPFGIDCATHMILKF